MGAPSTPGAALTQLARGRVGMVRPGAGLAIAAAPLASPQRALGKFPEQWNEPGPNSKFACPSGSIAIPQLGADNVQVTANVFQYEIPEGYRFVATDVLLNAFAADWNPGSGQLLFTLVVTYSTGPRNVEFLTNLAFPLGMSGYPWPLRGRFEFDSRDVLTLVLTNTGIATPGQNDFAYGALNGFLYPAGEGA